MTISNPETKVGLLVLIAILALSTLFFWLNGIRWFQNGNELEAVFDRVEGLRPGSPVKYNGVDVGRISKMYFEDQKVIVAFEIEGDLELPDGLKASIASAGVVGDKYLELRPANVQRHGDRIQGVSPQSMEEFSASADTILDALKSIAQSLNDLLGDQTLTDSLKDTVLRVNQLAVTMERLAVNSEPRVYQLFDNINLAVNRLNEASLAANRLLTQLDGPAMADIQGTLANINSISGNLNRLSQILAENDTQIITLIDDAHETMVSINQAAQTIDAALKSLTPENGAGDNPGQLKETLSNAGKAVQKVDSFMKKLEKVHAAQSLGAGYHEERQLEVDYSLNLQLNETRGLHLHYEDIGGANLATVQLSADLANPNYRGRAGLYKNEFGLGLDYLIDPRFRVGLDAWDTDSVNLGLTSNWQLSNHWSLSVSTATNLDSEENDWNVKGWYRF